MGTRIQDKSRPTKRYSSKADYTITGEIITNWEGRKPKIDKKGFPLYKGLPFPVLMHIDITP